MQTEYPKKEQAALHARFDKLQKKLIPLWEQIGRSDPGGAFLEEPNTMVVLPSITVDVELDLPSMQGYEERMLFMLFLLRQPHVQVIYITSIPIPEEIVDYYLGILPSVTLTNARKRLFLVSPQDASTVPLVQKLLERPKLIAHIQSLIPDLNMAHLVPFLTTDLERDFAVRLGIPMYAADPRFFAFGTKSGCRRIFSEENVQHPIGAEDIHGRDELLGAIRQMRKQKTALARVIVKHNEGVSGFGNASLDLTDLPVPGSPGEIPALETRLREMKFELPEVALDWYMERLEEKGGIVEEFVGGERMASPSVQLRITPLAEVELLSTHDQMLGGAGGQTYLGARFPANPEYGPLIMHEALKVGKRFAREGIVGRFALDFIVVGGQDGSWTPYAIEVNLRKGGTTHPFLTLHFLTGGQFETDSGRYFTAQGQEKFYVATDTLKSNAYKSLKASDLFDLVSNHRLHFDHTSHTGIVLHMISGVAALGKIGLTAIGNSPEHAEDLYRRFIEVIDQAVHPERQ